MSKIIDLKNLPIPLLYPNRRRGVMVHCHGCWDVCHYGHFLHLEQAKSYGDTLIVTVTSDRYVNKGNGRPIFNQMERAKMIAALEIVDYVAISDYADVSIPMTMIHPDIFCKGCDYNENSISEIEIITAEEIQAKIIFTNTKKYSTTEIIEKLKS